MNTYFPQNLSLSQLRQLPQERMQMKIYKNDDLILTPQSNRSQLNEVVENLELQWQSIRKQHLDQRSSSRSPAKNNLINQLKNKDKVQQQCILKKVVPLSTINLARVQDQQLQQSVPVQRNTLKESSHFQYIANKYCNIYRRPSPEQTQIINHSFKDRESNSIGKNYIQQHNYHTNNLKALDERVRINSQDKNSPGILSNSNILKRDGPQRKRMSQYSKEQRDVSQTLVSVKQQGMQNQRIIPKKRL